MSNRGTNLCFNWRIFRPIPDGTESIFLRGRWQTVTLQEFVKHLLKPFERSAFLDIHSHHRDCSWLQIALRLRWFRNSNSRLRQVIKKRR